MLLHLSTWPEIRDALERSKTIVIPIGSTEQHGPTGLLGTDWLCPEIIAHEAHQSGADILVGPTINVGMAQHHLGFPGSLTLRPSTFMAVIGDWVRSLTLHGWNRIYFLNGHGGNIPTIQAAFSELYAEASLAGRPASFALKLGNWWELPAVAEVIARHYSTGHGSHATPSEIAITQWAYPHAVKRADYTPRIAGAGPIRDAADFRLRHPDGRMGSDPGQATPEIGGLLVQTAVQGLLAAIAAFGRE
ncbi:creatininase family protein [Nitrospirillum iridis]|uniref:Creatinine amidohydrolase/Fe(II)-dependent formamide hydrolase-like protein n=1 Tax=Nitrospirillum iridis TaxID=765888 RepID=A0A7X0EF52_9PROT|nr:creatininase family protein [Nitrospirillum iridis]MBB6252134.1 creatinine amidohydrolase/Fe(II)-dependent formamide hydrolase-like protein [Nitrospirillum iridis]